MSVNVPQIHARVAVDAADAQQLVGLRPRPAVRRQRPGTHLFAFDRPRRVDRPLPGAVPQPRRLGRRRRPAADAQRRVDPAQPHVDEADRRRGGRRVVDSVNGDVERRALVGRAQLQPSNIIDDVVQVVTDEVQDVAAVWTGESRSNQRRAV